jgi:hypothetical protein
MYKSKLSSEKYTKKNSRKQTKNIILKNMGAKGNRNCAVICEYGKQSVK